MLGAVVSSLIFGAQVGTESTLPFPTWIDWVAKLYEKPFSKTKDLFDETWASKSYESGFVGFKMMKNFRDSYSEVAIYYEPKVKNSSEMFVAAEITWRDWILGRGGVLDDFKIERKSWKFSYHPYMNIDPDGNYSFTVEARGVVMAGSKKLPVYTEFTLRKGDKDKMWRLLGTKRNDAGGIKFDIAIIDIPERVLVLRFTSSYDSWRPQAPATARNDLK